MIIPARKILGVVLLMAVFLISSHGLAQEQSQGDQNSVAEGELPATAPELADIIPLATQLSGRLASLENEVAALSDISETERKYAEIEENLKGPEDLLQRMKDSGDFRFNKLAALRKAVEQEKALFEEISRPLRKAIGRLDASRGEWLGEKKRWSEWESLLLKEGVPDQIKSTFSMADHTIDTALKLVLEQLQAMLQVQNKAGHIHAGIIALAAESDGLISDRRRGVVLDAFPPMFSSQYFSQFGSELWYEMHKGLEDISWPDNRFFARQGWIVLLQSFLSIIVIIAIYRNRQTLNGSERWRFLAARPFSAGLFLGVITAIWLYEYRGAPDSWLLACKMVGVISFARLFVCLIKSSWKRQFVYGSMIVYIVNSLLYVIGMPFPIFRLYTVLTALAGLLFCLRWAGQSVRDQDSGLYAGSLRLGAFLFLVIIIAELWGKAELGVYLFISLFISIGVVLPFILLRKIILGGLEWIFYGTALRRVNLPQSDADALVRRSAFFVDVFLWGLIVLPAILMIWGSYESLKEATKALLALGFNMGSLRINVGLVIISASILYGSFLISWILQILFINQVLVKRGVERGIRLSIGRLVHYALTFVGFLLAIAALGFEITKLTIILSALGVGIGFGLQSVVNNFVSGLILLFERPVRVGDTIELAGNWAEIKKIGLRATTVQTFDQADVIIPNADLVTHQVTNWTLSNRRVRLIIPVGVAYGSEIPLVVETLMACGKANARVAKTPEPQVLFLSFGESSLDFELRVWILDVDDRLQIRSELHQEIDRSFRAAKIQIAFPQRDLHLRSLDEPVILRPPETPT